AGRHADRLDPASRDLRERRVWGSAPKPPVHDGEPVALRGLRGGGRRTHLLALRFGPLVLEPLDRRDPAREAGRRAAAERLPGARSDQRRLRRALEERVAVAGILPRRRAGQVLTGGQRRVLDARDDRLVVGVALAQAGEAAQI